MTETERLQRDVRGLAFALRDAIRRLDGARGMAGAICDTAVQRGALILHAPETEQ